MHTLDEIEVAVGSLPPLQQEELLRFLTARLKRRPTGLSGSPREGRSVLEIAPVSVKEVLRPLSPDDDLLDEMLEGRV